MRNRLARLFEVAIYIGLSFLAVKFGIPPSVILPPQIPEQQPPTIIIHPPQTPPTPEVKPVPKPDPLAALGRVVFGRAGCTATVIGPRRADWRWWVLTAHHCIEGQGNHGMMRMKDGRVIKITVEASNPTADYCWCHTDDVIESLPFARVAKDDPAPGTKVWHAGYGVDRPGNREDGIVTADANDRAQLQFAISVSSGDSGGGIFRTDTGELVSCVCCTFGGGGNPPMRGASTRAIRLGIADIKFQDRPNGDVEIIAVDVLP